MWRGETFSPLRGQGRQQREASEGQKWTGLCVIPSGGGVSEILRSACRSSISIEPLSVELSTRI